MLALNGISDDRLTRDRLERMQVEAVNLRRALEEITAAITDTQHEANVAERREPELLEALTELRRKNKDLRDRRRPRSTWGRPGVVLGALVLICMVVGASPILTLITMTSAYPIGMACGLAAAMAFVCLGRG